ncbi:unnamed protein product [Trichogramma brassicae]|uniref:Plastocyanin-like domain-containing protein n=1 Tax=Trichogramma brassicae TaxID=86971 RepID=A0A6H5I8Q3_9HYME|nr:unnamed protein product [Trichogramma brassicae]
MLSESTTIHWHGFKQRGTPYMDGVPFVSQCPILPGQTFQYIFNATEAGTYFWHSHIGRCWSIAKNPSSSVSQLKLIRLSCRVAESRRTVRTVDRETLSEKQPPQESVHARRPLHVADRLDGARGRRRLRRDVPLPIASSTRDSSDQRFRSLPALPPE